MKAEKKREEKRKKRTGKPDSMTLQLCRGFRFSPRQRA
jgi:hypothetical protein